MYVCPTHTEDSVAAFDLRGRHRSGSIADERVIYAYGSCSTVVQLMSHASERI